MAESSSLLWRLRLSQLIFAACMILSFGGIYWAVRHTGCDADAGRGGAIADALALVVMFLDRNSAGRLFDVIRSLQETRRPTESEEGKDVQSVVRQEIKLVFKLLEADARKQRSQNIYLAGATAVGTLAWGFGDIVARHFIGHRC
jgi:hypothetical protein